MKKYYFLKCQQLSYRVSFIENDIIIYIDYYMTNHRFCFNKVNDSNEFISTINILTLNKNELTKLYELIELLADENICIVKQFKNQIITFELTKQMLIRLL